MTTAIIGYTGFVGSNLIRQKHFDQCYNSQNIEAIIGKSFDLVICAGAPAIKWLANKEPIQDRENLQKLMACLQRITAKKFILISTVDVYSMPIQVNEDTIIDSANLHPYGKHRWELEILAQKTFDALIIRLPGLFGQGLKKNIIYDLLHNNLIDKIHKDSRFQFYCLDNLWQDIQIALTHELTLVNFATEPTSVAEVASEAFGIEFTNTPELNIAQYDMQTRYFQLFGSHKPGYLYDKYQTLQKIKNFVQQQTK